MGLRLGGSIAGIGAGAAEGLQSIIDYGQREESNDLARQRLGMESKRLDLLSAADKRQQEQWNIAKAEEERQNQLIPVEGLMKAFPIAGVGEYAKNVAGGLGVIEKDPNGVEGIRRKDIAKVREALKDPQHLTELSNLEMSHWTQQVKDATDAYNAQLTNSEEGGVVDLGPYMQAKSKAEMGLQAATGRNQGLMKFREEEDKRAKNDIEKGKLAVEEAKAGKVTSLFDLAMRAGQGDKSAKKALSELEQFYRDKSSDSAGNKALDRALKIQELTQKHIDQYKDRYDKGIVALETEYSKRAEGTNPMSNEEWNSRKRRIEAEYANSVRQMGYTPWAESEEPAAATAPQQQGKKTLGGGTVAGQAATEAAGGQELPRARGKEVPFTVPENPEDVYGPTISGAPDSVPVEKGEPVTAFGQPAFGVLPRTSLAALGGASPRTKVIKGKEPVIIDKATAAKFLAKAGGKGNEEKARAMARAAGYSW